MGPILFLSRNLMNHGKVQKRVMADNDPFPKTPNFADLEQQAFGDIPKRDYPSIDLKARKEGEEEQLKSRRKSRRKSKKLTQKTARKSTKVTISPAKISGKAGSAVPGAKDEDTWTFVPSEEEKSDDAVSNSKKTFNVKLYAGIGVGVVILIALIWIGVVWFQKVSRDNALAAKFLDDGEDRSNPDVWFMAVKRYKEKRLGGKHSLEYIPALKKAIELQGSRHVDAHHNLHVFTYYHVHGGKDLMTGEGTDSPDVLQSLYDGLILWTEKIPQSRDPWMYLVQVLTAKDKPLLRDNPDHAKEAVDAAEMYKTLGGAQDKYEDLKRTALANRKRLCGY